MKIEESNYFITENRSGVSIRLKNNNRTIKRVLMVTPDDFIPDDPDVPDDFDWTGAMPDYPLTMEQCYNEARRFIAELDRIDSYRSLPVVKLPRYLDELAHRESSGE